MAKGVFHFKAKLMARRLPIKIADLSKLLKALILTFSPGRRDRVPDTITLPRTAMADASQRYAVGRARTSSLWVLV
jgi:hypothetical protein